MFGTRFKLLVFEHPDRVNTGVRNLNIEGDILGLRADSVLHVLHNVDLYKKDSVFRTFRTQITTMLLSLAILYSPILLPSTVKLQLVSTLPTTSL